MQRQLQEHSQHLIQQQHPQPQPQPQQTHTALTDKELLERITKQWNSGLWGLNYYSVEVPPRAPLTTELTHYPPRSRYYETFICTWTFAFSILLIYSLEYLLGSRLHRFMASKRRVTALQFGLLVVPFQICVLDFPVKLYPNFVLPFNAACVLLYLGCLLHKRLTLCGTVATASEKDPEQRTEILAFASICSPAALESPHHGPRFNDLLSIYRSIVYISTAVCIFARDQPCWNNDFSKTYSFGTGLMDVGIGCFIVCIGSLGPTAVRRIDQVDRPQALRKAALQAGILTACGLVKTTIVVILAAVRHTTFDDSWREYGVHWNAFYSLAVARLLGASLELLVLHRKTPPLLFAALVAAAHELTLSQGGLAKLVLAPGRPEPHNRSGLIGQNREGLASVPGLVTLYLAGLQLGRWARDWTCGVGRVRTLALWKILGLLVAALAWRPVLVASGGAILPESRRLLSPSYSAWVLAFSCFCLACASFVLGAKQRLMDGLPKSEEKLTPLHLREVDSAGLLYFLVSNLLTGVFNFFLNLAVGNRENIDGPICFAVILAYSVSVFCITRLAVKRFSFRMLQDTLMKLLCRA